jgi:hypothetical protein
MASADIAAPFVLEMLARDGHAWVRESSDSMAPLVRRGDRLCLAPEDRARVRPGALVAYLLGARLVVHRVLARHAVGVVTKGDALPERDGVVPWEAVLGRVVTLADARGRTLHDLSSLPWSLSAGALALCSRLGEAVGRARPGAARRAAWMLTRLPAHLLARMLR